MDVGPYILSNLCASIIRKGRIFQLIPKIFDEGSNVRAMRENVVTYNSADS